MDEYVTILAGSLAFLLLIVIVAAFTSWAARQK